MNIASSPGSPQVPGRETAAPAPAAERAPDVTADIVVAFAYRAAHAADRERAAAPAAAR
jgi:hypothetical protein